MTSGKGHNDRAPCSIAAVNEKGDTILSLVVKCTDIYSPLTQITGLTREDIAAGARAGVFAGMIATPQTRSTRRDK